MVSPLMAPVTVKPEAVNKPLEPTAPLRVVLPETFRFPVTVAFPEATKVSAVNVPLTPNPAT